MPSKVTLRTLLDKQREEEYRRGYATKKVETVKKEAAEKENQQAFLEVLTLLWPERSKEKAKVKVTDYSIDILWSLPLTPEHALLLEPKGFVQYNIEILSRVNLSVSKGGTKSSLAGEIHVKLDRESFFTTRERHSPELLALSLIEKARGLKAAFLKLVDYPILTETKDALKTEAIRLLEEQKIVLLKKQLDLEEQIRDLEEKIPCLPSPIAALAKLAKETTA